MQISFDTGTIGQAEAQGLVALLSSLFPTSSTQPVTDTLTRQTPEVVPAPSPRNEQEAIFGVPTQSNPIDAPTTGPTLVQPEVSAEPNTKRTRRTKAQIEADEAAAKQNIPTSTVAGIVEPSPAAESAKTTVASPSENSVSAATVKPITADELRALLNAYIAKHSMEEAIAILQKFKCNRVSEALALDPAKLAELAGQLNG